MNKTIVKQENLYKTMIFMVHPDRNPTDPNATRKTQEVNVNRNNIDMLANFVRLWHLPIIIENYVYRNTNRNTNQNTNRNTNFYTNPNGDSVVVNVGDIVNIRSFGEVFVIGVDDVTKGRMAGGVKFTVYSERRRNFYNFKTINGKLFGAQILGTMNRNQIKDLQTKYIGSYGRKPGDSTIVTEQEMFAKHGIERNRNYMGKGYMVRIIGFGSPFELIRTTAKCVIIKYMGQEHRKSITKVHEVIK